MSDFTDLEMDLYIMESEDEIESMNDSIMISFLESSNSDNVDSQQKFTDKLRNLVQKVKDKIKEVLEKVKQKFLKIAAKIGISMSTKIPGGVNVPDPKEMLDQLDVNKKTLEALKNAKTEKEVEAIANKWRKSSQRKRVLKKFRLPALGIALAAISDVANKAKNHMDKTERDAVQIFAKNVKSARLDMKDGRRFQTNFSKEREDIKRAAFWKKQAGLAENIAFESSKCIFGYFIGTNMGDGIISALTGYSANADKAEKEKKKENDTYWAIRKYGWKMPKNK